MASVNKVIILGNLGRDPEIRYSADGASICNLSIATTSQWKGKLSNERHEETEWHRVVMYNRLAEIASEYLKKGRPIYIEGRLRTRKWQDKDTGTDRYSTEIIADRMQMLGGRDDIEHNKMQPEYSQQSHEQISKRVKSKTSASNSDIKDLVDMDDDIPF
ncbi:MAG: single-stranded DNA-binding protein [Bordetella sp.]|nr:MAG: single-stranded DNA-binding protein [Bordetella sp.]